jgi:hypothetical protein
MLSARNLQGINIVVSGLGKGFMAWRYKEWGGIRKAETEVVRIKGRRRDKGGGEVGKTNQQGGRISPLKININCLPFVLINS